MAGEIGDWIADEVRTAQIRCVYIDIVHFSRGRSIESQTAIMGRLAMVVRTTLRALAVEDGGLLIIPTGDGVCLCLIDQIEPFDQDIRIALMVLEQLHLLNLAEPDRECRFAVRIGLNENQDNLVTDIAGGRNVIGLGINMAQRVMSVAGPSQLMLGPSVYARLAQRRLYRPHLTPQPAIVKHGERLLCYGYCNGAMACFAAAPAGRLSSGHETPVRAARVLDLPPGVRTRSRSKRSAEPSFRLSLR